MHQNIIFLLVDGFRADQCFGKDKTSVTPNIDSLIQKGMYFTKIHPFFPYNPIMCKFYSYFENN